MSSKVKLALPGLGLILSTPVVLGWLAWKYLPTPLDVLGSAVAFSIIVLIYFVWRWYSFIEVSANHENDIPKAIWYWALRLNAITILFYGLVIALSRSAQYQIA